MRVLHYDNWGNLTCIDVACVTALHNCHADDDISETIEWYDDERGVDGIHIIPTSENICDLFIPCRSCDYDITRVWENGVLDLSSYGRAYDASKWKLY